MSYLIAGEKARVSIVFAFGTVNAEAEERFSHQRKDDMFKMMVFASKYGCPPAEYAKFYLDFKSVGYNRVLEMHRLLSDIKMDGVDINGTKEAY